MLSILIESWQQTFSEGRVSRVQSHEWDTTDGILISKNCFALFSVLQVSGLAPLCFYGVFHWMIYHCLRESVSATAGFFVCRS